MKDGRKFHGLFIGVDNYESSAFGRLRYAKKDAIALHALFTDTFSENAILMLDSAATKDKLTTEIGHVQAASTDEDVVVITYSGHGTPDGYLATRDARPDHLAETALSLDRLFDLVCRIRAQVVVLVLDCCFSGRAGAKVLRAPEHGDSVRGPGSAFESVAGDGILVIAAAEADQEARESGEFRHGLLTHYLLEGLRGHPAVRDGARVSLLKLADHVASKLHLHPPKPGKTQQTPVVTGRMTHVSLPILVPGPHFAALVDEVAPRRATRAISSLADLGVPGPVITAWQKRHPRLNDLQLRAINEGGVLRGEDVLVSAPTSAGKSLIGELAAVRAVADGGRAVFLLSTRALVNEQYDRFRETYAAAGIQVIRVTGELRDQTKRFVQGNFDIAILTYEKYIGMVSGLPGLLSKTNVLVVDEIQTLTLPDRGPGLELLLAWIRLRRLSGTVPQFVGLSAVLGEPEELAQWLGAELVAATHRDVPLLEGVITAEGEYRHLDESGQEQRVQLISAGDEDDLPSRVVRALVDAGEQVIVFMATRREAIRFARELAGELGRPPASATTAALSSRGHGRLVEELLRCLKGGVAFHISDLGEDARIAVERTFRFTNSEIRVIVATTTLSQGLNLAADAVVIDRLLHPGEPERPYSVAEYRNMAGRAGRTGIAPRGRAFVIARGPVDAKRKWSDYVTAAPEPVRSVLTGHDLRSLILFSFAGPAAELRIMSATHVEAFLKWTFAAHLNDAGLSARSFSPSQVTNALTGLVEEGLIRSEADGFVLTALGKVALRSGLSVDSVIALSQALRAVSPTELTRMTLVAAAHLTEELLDVRFSLPKGQWRKEWLALQQKLRHQNIAEPMLERLLGDYEPLSPGAARARRSLACVRWSRGVSLPMIERELLEHQYIEVTSTGPVEQAARRTSDVIEAVIDIAMVVHRGTDLGDLTEILPAQLELGVPAGLVPVLRHLAPRLDREASLDLARDGFDTAGAILGADADDLLAHVGDPALVATLVAAAEKADARDEVDEPFDFPPPVD
ncbi:DEAD/DEAH box helicase [Actinosynnema sp. NPDC047251]|uniref:DEAD/DEAH box helicase domain-containing protein n=1 Tax=Saccharothrix espanaensis (strain ATCC 51144 / DSM 44229 / JCM 9112 / NBRC 15066 / NRRL 15764) TaxID=1179773 RepID=K0JX85_SACES|nr:DEAD/DEAH box helicase [Saccharothrix espanaensis]CCH29374.1 DEAD/DEAH box helicase domain-containing protein [Saccharothrix espanaensis DSM 44229]